jgi:hypothetical protein
MSTTLVVAWMSPPHSLVIGSTEGRGGRFRRLSVGGDAERR